MKRIIFLFIITVLMVSNFSCSFVDENKQIDLSTLDNNEKRDANEILNKIKMEFDFLFIKLSQINDSVTSLKLSPLKKFDKNVLDIKAKIEKVEFTNKSELLNFFLDDIVPRHVFISKNRTNVVSYVKSVFNERFSEEIKKVLNIRRKLYKEKDNFVEIFKKLVQKKVYGRIALEYVYTLELLEKIQDKIFAKDNSVKGSKYNLKVASLSKIDSKIPAVKGRLSKNFLSGLIEMIIKNYHYYKLFPFAKKETIISDIADLLKKDYHRLAKVCKRCLELRKRLN